MKFVGMHIIKNKYIFKWGLIRKLGMWMESIELLDLLNKTIIDIIN